MQTQRANPAVQLSRHTFRGDGTASCPLCTDGSVVMFLNPRTREPDRLNMACEACEQRYVVSEEDEPHFGRIGVTPDATGQVSVTIPISISVSLGTPELAPAHSTAYECGKCGYRMMTGYTHRTQHPFCRHGHGPMRRA